jgi:uncharacterized protein DUF5335
MKLREIRPPDWNTFLDVFSQQHEGWLVTVEDIPAGGGGPRVEARDLPLQGVFTNPHEQSISIALGRAPDEHLTHTVRNPERIVVEQSESGADQGLTIERQSGRATRLKFKTAVRPEEVDGMPGRAPTGDRSVSRRSG